jgi:hypothetical protein
MREAADKLMNLECPHCMRRSKIYCGIAPVDANNTSSERVKKREKVNMSDDLVTEASRVQKLLIQQNDEINRLRNRIQTLEAALRDFLLWGDHCQHCDYDDEWAKIEVRARKALEGKDD